MFGLFRTLVLLLCWRMSPLCQVDVAATEPSSEPPPSARPGQGLAFSVGEHGLNALSFNGESLLRSPGSGNIQPAKSILGALADAILPPKPFADATFNKETQTVTLTYPWGNVSCAYEKKENNLGIRCEIANRSRETVPDVSLRLLQLDFPNTPQGNTLDAGMFGFGFEGKTHPLYQYPLVADPRFVAPIVRVDFGKNTLNFCSDDLQARVEIPYATNPLAPTSYPFVISCPGLEPAATKVLNVSLRFASIGTDAKNLSADVLRRYAAEYPFKVHWEDRRPIGAIFLAGSGKKLASNPRRWIMDDGSVDVLTQEGRKKFRASLLRLADDSIAILRETDAQGMITWDPEGQEFASACYYGDPRLTRTLAPEMEEGARSVIDEYFEKFRAAGLRVGICIRPQQIALENGTPRQTASNDGEATRVLEAKIAYAKDRWGCTLFYVDSSTTAGRPLDPDVFKNVAEAHPDVLLIPENESSRYFAYSAPLNSYLHHRITATPVGARLVYPGAFSVLLVEEGIKPEDRNAIRAAIRNGDILLFNCWYRHEGLSEIKNLYREAKASAVP